MFERLKLGNQQYLSLSLDKSQKKCTCKSLLPLSTRESLLHRSKVLDSGTSDSFRFYNMTDCDFHNGRFIVWMFDTKGHGPSHQSIVIPNEPIKHSQRTYSMILSLKSLKMKHKMDVLYPRTGASSIQISNTRGYRT